VGRAAAADRGEEADVAFVDSLPHTATGKLLKTKLREDFRGHKLPGLPS
jgi:acyl-CoA synthetase (AMP-forming)/AMP-acid ligase II